MQRERLCICWIFTAVITALSVFPLCAEDWGTFSWNFDYLFWRPSPDGFFTVLDQKQDELTFSSDLNAVVLPVEKMVFRTKINYVSPRLQSGFRLGIGYPLCDYKVTLQWTCFCPNEGKTFTSATPSLIPLQILNWEKGMEMITTFPQSNNLFLSTQFLGTHLKSTWSLDLHILDVQLKAAENPEDCWSFEPELFLRLFYVKQSLFLKTQGSLLGASFDFGVDGQESGVQEILAEAIVKERIEGEFTGIGPRLGLILSRKIFCNFTLEGKAGVSLGLGKKTAKGSANFNRYNSPFPQADGDNFHYTLKRDQTCSLPLVDLFIGLAWETHCISPGRRLVLKLGWEHLYFFNQSVVSVDLLRQPHLSHEEDALTTQGLTLSGKWEF